MNRLLFLLVGMCFMLNHAAAQKRKYTERENPRLDLGIVQPFKATIPSTVSLNVDVGNFLAFGLEASYLYEAPTEIELATYSGHSFIGEAKIYPFGRPLFCKVLRGRKGSPRRSWFQSWKTIKIVSTKNPCLRRRVNPLRGLAISGGYVHTQHRMQVAGYNDTTYDFTLNNHGAFVGLSYTIRIERLTFGVRNRWTLDRPVLNNPDGTQETINRRWGVRSLSVPGAFIGFNF